MGAHGREIDLFSLAMLFVAIVLVALALIGVAERGTSPFVVIPPMALGFRAILNLGKK